MESRIVLPITTPTTSVSISISNGVLVLMPLSATLAKNLNYKKMSALFATKTRDSCFPALIAIQSSMVSVPIFMALT